MGRRYLKKYRQDAEDVKRYLIFGRKRSKEWRASIINCLEMGLFNPETSN